jgi:hypothetical protein
MFVLFWNKDISVKAALKMLVKLTPNGQKLILKLFLENFDRAKLFVVK